MKLSSTIDNARMEIEKVAKKRAASLISAKEKETATEDVVFNDEEISNEFEKFWKKVQYKFQTQLESSFESVDIVAILSKYGQTPNFVDNVSSFGKNLQHSFNIRWIKPEHLEFKSKEIKKNVQDLFLTNEEKWRSQIVDFIKDVISRIESELLKLITVNDFTKIAFQEDSITFNYQNLVREYLFKVINILEQEHKKTAGEKNYKLTDQFKAIFCYYAAQKGIAPFKKVQTSSKLKFPLMMEKKIPKNYLSCFAQRERLDNSCYINNCHISQECYKE